MTPRSPRPGLARLLFFFIAVFGLLAVSTAGAEGQGYNPDSILAAEGYITPPDTIAQGALAPRWQNFSFTYSIVPFRSVMTMETGLCSTPTRSFRRSDSACLRSVMSIVFPRK